VPSCQRDRRRRKGLPESAASVGRHYDFFTAFGFVIGAACSMAAGYIGMRVAVISNSRVAQVVASSTEGAARMSFNGGAVTGLLVVGPGLLFGRDLLFGGRTAIRTGKSDR